MKQIIRSDEINTILKTINTQFPDDMGATLEAYISQLEANQKIMQLDTIQPWDADNPPIWSHERREKRDQQRRERANRKRNNYQSIKPL